MVRVKSEFDPLPVKRSENPDRCSLADEKLIYEKSHLSVGTSSRSSRQQHPDWSDMRRRQSSRLQAESLWPWPPDSEDTDTQT